MNKSFFKDIVIDRGKPLRFFIVESAQQYSAKHEKKNRRSSTKKKYRKRKREEFLNRYHFAYAGRAVVSHFRKFALRLMKIASSEINNIAQQRINQVICQGRQETRSSKKIFHGAIEDVYQTPFRLFVKFAKHQLQKIKNKILK